MDVQGVAQQEMDYVVDWTGIEAVEDLWNNRFPRSGGFDDVLGLPVKLGGGGTVHLSKKVRVARKCNQGDGRFISDRSLAASWPLMGFRGLLLGYSMSS